MNNTIEKEGINRLLELGAKAPEQIEIAGGRPVIVVPSGMQVASLENHFPPLHIKRNLTLLEAGSFADYVNRFKSLNTLIFAQVSETGVTFKALLDYHAPAPELTPSVCAHAASFTAIETPEWKIWSSMDRQWLNQVQFAEFIEDNAVLFAEPKGAELLELIRDLKGHKNARFNQSVDLPNGGFSVGYDEDIVIKAANKTGAGELELPPTVTAGIAIFQGGEKYEIKARLKRNIEERKLFLKLETISRPTIVRENIMALVSQISEKTTIIPLIGLA